MSEEQAPQTGKIITIIMFKKKQKHFCPYLHQFGFSSTESESHTMSAK